MQPQDKAKELVRKFIPHSRMLYETYGRDGFILSAKQCALIAVDELIEQESKHDPSINDVRYLEEVKQEIEKL